MNSDFDDMYQSVLLDHSKRPRNYGNLPGATSVRGDNPSCGDEIDLHVKFATDGTAEDIKFTGQGCAICIASASLMTMKLKRKPRAEAQEIARAFHNIVTTEVADPPKQLGDLRLLSGVRKFPQRVKCAMLAWRAFEQATQEGAGGTVSTEA